MTEPSSSSDSEALDPKFAADLERLHQLTVRARWSLVVCLWLTVGSLSLWGIRFHIGLLWDHFTWSSLRYALLFNRLSAAGLILCTWMTLSALLRQSHNVLFGLASDEQVRLHRQLLRIKQQGESHPLWRWLYGSM